MKTNQKDALQFFPNPKPARDYLIHIDLPEFTCLCPVTGQPDFAEIALDYIPNESCLELKALKLYIWSYRKTATFHETVSNKILDDILECVMPHFARVTAKFNVRGGTYPTVTCVHRSPDWKPTTDTQHLNL